jgi:predicted nucleotidyltransferase component of viral defense system
MNAPTPDELRLGALPPETAQAFRACTALLFFRTGGWYLAGGTALALQAGHRRSVDLDFFTSKSDFSVADVERTMMEAGAWQTTLSSKGTLYGEFVGAKVSFIAYPFFRPSAPAFECGTVTVLSVDDIAVMKVIAVSQRGRKRDFLDLYWYLAVHGAQLTTLVTRVLDQYPQDHNVRHLLKSLCYFVDAEEDAMPQVFFDAGWESVKRWFEREVPRAAKALLRID